MGSSAAIPSQGYCMRQESCNVMSARCKTESLVATNHSVGEPNAAIIGP